MKRLLIGALAVVTAIAAWALPAPDTATGAVPQLPELPETGQRSSVWFCPGVDGEVDPILTTSLASTGLASFSLPSAGEVIDGFQTRVEPGIADWDVGDVLLFHPGPAIVETSTTPSAAAVVFRGPAQVATTGCNTPAKEWFFTGGRSGPAEVFTLRLFNPLLEQGRVTIQVNTEFGFEPLLDLESINVSPRDWVDVPLSLVLGDREQLAVQVAVTEGVVIPSLSIVSPSGLAVWPGESPSPVWEFPLAQVAGTSGTISIWNPGTEAADVTIELMGRRGPIGLFELTVGPSREERFAISPTTSLEAGAVVRSSGGVVAAVISEGADGLAGAAGSPRAATRWLVPGHGVAGGLASFVFVLNSGDEPVEVEAGPVGAEPTSTASVPGHAIARLEITGRGAEISASGPVSVAWAAVGPADIGLSRGTPLEAVVP
ncbi:MAG: DUF5719 family protein [Acidimicrobiia bacterium]|nr:DUF5719 family protein [Acidimicrobiia bacterium]